MFVVIFRAVVKEFDEEYSIVAKRMRDIALEQFGCLEFVAMTEGDQEMALSYWVDEESIRKWKSYSEHIIAQQLGRERWYQSYLVQVAEIKREYGRSVECQA